MRKTIDIRLLTARVNSMIKASKDHGGHGHERAALADLISVVLHESRRYAGFTYLPSELLPNGQLKPGYDDTARVYSVKRYKH